MNDYVKKLIGIFLISLILVGFGSCNFNKDKEQSHEEPIDPPEIIIPISEAKSQYENYSNRRVPLIQRYEDSINRGAGYDDKMQQQNQQNNKDKAQADGAPAKFDVARYVYYNLDTLKQYIKYIEQEAKLSKVDITNLRLYFSNYSEDPKNVHPRQNTIMLSPTITEGGKDYVFYIDDSDPKNQKAVLLNSDFSPRKTEGMGDANAEDKKAYASFLPSLTKTKPNTVVFPYFNGKSVTSNKGTGVPPPDN